IPVALNLRHLYPWADPSRLDADSALRRKALWLNPQIFLIRAGIYLASWVLLAWLLGRLSDREDRTGERGLSRAMRAPSGGGLVVLGLTSSFAAFDWIMSLDPHWMSTIFGIYFWSACLLAALAALILAILSFRVPLACGPVITVEHLHDVA